VIARDDGTPDFHALRSKRRGHEAVLFAFDLIEYDGVDLRDLPPIERKRRLKKLLGRAKRRSIQFVEHLTGDGPTVFRRVCKMGLEGIVSKRVDAPYRSGPSRAWVKAKNPANDAARGSAKEEWRLTLPGLHFAPSGGSPSGCTSGALALTGGGSSPASSLSLEAASISPTATAGSEVVFAILSSAAARA
jgi:bifunctional non-homologous end joining protein LigD